MNKDSDRKFELGGGYSTDPKSFALKFKFKLFAISRWLTETWPLGVDKARQGRVDEGELRFKVKPSNVF